MKHSTGQQQALVILRDDWRELFCITRFGENISSQLNKLEQQQLTHPDPHTDTAKYPASIPNSLGEHSQPTNQLKQKIQKETSVCFRQEKKTFVSFFV